MATPLSLTGTTRHNPALGISPVKVMKPIARLVLLRYVNAGRFSGAIRVLAGAPRLKPRWVVVNAGAIARIDSGVERKQKRWERALGCLGGGR